MGYVSPDFNNHVIGFFVEPFLAAHDRARVEVYCYDNADKRDEVTERFRGYADHWREIDQLDDAAAADLIRRDGIDILIDLAGHTRAGRSALFARKPAPVQMAYLGYPLTSGLTAMDYRISDGYCDPPGLTDAHYVEANLRLPASLWCYRPPDDIPVVAPLPAASNGYVTFGSFNVPAKIGEQVAALWAQLLARVPDSRLLFAPIPLGQARARIQEMFVRHGVDAARLEFMPRMATVEYQALRHRVDIALDTFPCGGASTTCETLWMGVPLVTLTGNTFASRAGTSLMTALGMPELVAPSGERYIEIAAGLARDPEALASMRKGLRGRMRLSPLTDGVALARGLEELYRKAFATWCAETPAASE
ncbi:MAG: hypothetical protein WDN04_21330 [Rhodospirillales bacterium]